MPPTPSSNRTGADKLEMAIEQEHPRKKLADGTSMQFPLCASTGRILKNASHETYDFDSFGLGISNYFKMLKSLSILFALLYGVMWLGLINVYWSGENS